MSANWHPEDGVMTTVTDASQSMPLFDLDFEVIVMLPLIPFGPLSGTRFKSPVPRIYPTYFSTDFARTPNAATVMGDSTPTTPTGLPSGLISPH